MKEKWYLTYDGITVNKNSFEVKNLKNAYCYSKDG